MLDAQTIATVKATIPLLVETGPKLTAHFYDRMFTHNPELKEIFNMSNQRNGDQISDSPVPTRACDSSLSVLPSLSSSSTSAPGTSSWDGPGSASIRPIVLHPSRRSVARRIRRRTALPHWRLISCS